MSAGKKKDVVVRELRRRGLEFVSQNQFHRAAQVYLELMDLEPEEGDWPKRAADCFWQLKDAAARLKYTVRAAEIYCDGGFLLKAVAMCKVVLSLDPSHQETQQRLALLYAKRPEASRNPVPPSWADPTAMVSSRAQGSEQTQEARRARARLAAALALRRIRAQRKITQEEGPNNADLTGDAPQTSGPTPQVTFVSPQVTLASPAAPSLSSPEQSRPATQPRPVPAPVQLDPAGPALPSLQPNVRAPSLHAISLHAHLPSERRSLVPTSPPTAYSISISQLPPADIMVHPPLPTFPALPQDMVELEPLRPQSSKPAPTTRTSRSAREGLPPPEVLFAPQQRAPLGKQPNSVDRAAPLTPQRPVAANRAPAPGRAAPPARQGAPDRRSAFQGPAAFQRPAVFIRPAALIGPIIETSATPTVSATDPPPAPESNEPVLELDLPEDPETSPLDLAPLSLAPSAPLEEDEEAAQLELEDSPSAFDTLLSQFENMPLFGSLGHDSMITLIDGMVLVELVDGQVLFDEGDLADSMYVVTEGTLLAEVDRASGAPLLVAELSEGQFFGEIGLLSDQPRQARVRAKGSCRLLRIERQVVAQLMERDRTFLATLLEFLRDRLVTYVAQTSPLFATLPTAEGLELARSFEFLEVDDDTALLEPGQHATGLYVLLAGSAYCYRPKARQQFTTLGPGAMFGEGALLSRSASDMEVRTTSKCFALFLEAKRFFELIMTHPTVLAYVSSLDGDALNAEWSDHATLF